jgi:hypothetical protein
MTPGRRRQPRATHWFGGGKTHTLIAGAHLAFHGQELAPVVKKALESPDACVAKLLPKARSFTVVGVAGAKIPVVRAKGAELVPHTLWGTSPSKSAARNFIGK